MADGFKGSVMKKRFFDTMVKSVGAEVVVERSAGFDSDSLDVFRGRFVSFNPDTMDVWLADVYDKAGSYVAKTMMISGETLVSLRTVLPVLDLNELASKLKKAGLEVKLKNEEGALNINSAALVYRNGQVITGNKKLKARLERVIGAAYFGPSAGEAAP